jgi:23S rRNA pseudouridine1911/1915/1917 synthase
VPQPQAIPLDILYEDRDLLVLNKPAGLVVHPAPGHADGTLVNALLHHCRDLGGVGGVERPGIVHRLDKETSGLLVVAKNDAAMAGLVRLFQPGGVTKEYEALAHGAPPRESVL